MNNELLVTMIPHTVVASLGDDVVIDAQMTDEVTSDDVNMSEVARRLKTAPLVGHKRRNEGADDVA